MLDLKRREFITLLSGAAAWPVAARAQQPARPLIGFVSGGSPDTFGYLVDAFVALLANPDNPRFANDTKTVREAAQSMGLAVHVLTGRNGSELDTAFATLAQRRIDGLLVMSDPLMISERDRLVALAARHAIPAIYQNRELPAAGGLMGYGTSFPGVYHQLGVIAARILKGAKPADIPVEQPTRIELVINLKTARALGLEVPPMLLARADEVIE